MLRVRPQGPERRPWSIQRKKPGQIGRALLTQHYATRLGWRSLGRLGLSGIGLERLVGLLGEIGIEFADLRRLGDEALVGGLGIIGLDLDRLVQRPGAEKLLEKLGAILERLLGVIRYLGGDRLTRLREHAERLHRRVHALFADLLHVLKILDHRPLRPAARTGIKWVNTCLDLARSNARMRGNI